MDRRDITSEQAQKMVDRLRPTLGHLTRLAKRIDAEGFRMTTRCGEKRWPLSRSCRR
jgi:hypothetical protein